MARRTSPGEGRRPGNGGMCSPDPFPAPPPPLCGPRPAARPLPLTMSVSICPPRPAFVSQLGFLVGVLGAPWVLSASAGRTGCGGPGGCSGLPPGTPTSSARTPPPLVPPRAGRKGWHLEVQSLRPASAPRGPPVLVGAGLNRLPPPQPGQREQSASQRGMGEGLMMLRRVRSRTGHAHSRRLLKTTDPGGACFWGLPPRYTPHARLVCPSE